MAPFKALYLNSAGEIETRTFSEPYKPEGSQALVRVTHSGVNPADQKHYTLGWHSFVMGYDFAGIVESTGPSSSLQAGEAVFGMIPPAPRRAQHTGAHQDYLLADELLLNLNWRRPADLDPLTAATMTAVAGTAVDALFNCLGFGLPQAGLDGDSAAGRAILIWGGASAVGAAAVQLARAAGFGPILATASPRNHEALRRLGATHCFDYRSPAVVDDIRAAAAAAGKPLAVVFDTVCTGLGVMEAPGAGAPGPGAAAGESTPALARRCISDGAAPGDVRLACALPLPEGFEEWRFTTVGRWGDWEGEPGWGGRVRRGMDWLVANHAEAWRPMPKITVVRKAEDAAREIRRVAAGGASMEKVVVEHPIL